MLFIAKLFFGGVTLILTACSNGFSAVTEPPVARTLAVSVVTSSTCTLNAGVNPNGYETKAWFEWGPSGNLGNQSKIESMGEGKISATLSQTITNLSLKTTYHYRIAAENQGRTVLGEIRTCTTENPDSDGDGIRDWEELNIYKTDHQNPDTDNDNLSDLDEIINFLTDPNSSDTDSDGVTDELELDTYLTDPLVADTDMDGINDGEEISNYLTDPLNTDTDGDRFLDGVEVNVGSDPNDAMDRPPNAPDLVAVSISGPAAANAGDPIQVSFQLDNLGKDNAAAFNNEIYLYPAQSNVLLFDDFEDGLTPPWLQLIFGSVVVANDPVDGWVLHKTMNDDPSGGYVPVNQSFANFDVVLNTKPLVSTGLATSSFSVTSATGGGYGLTVDVASQQFSLDRRDGQWSSKITLNTTMPQQQSTRFFDSFDTGQLTSWAQTTQTMTIVNDPTTGNVMATSGTSGRVFNDFIDTAVTPSLSKFRYRAFIKRPTGSNGQIYYTLSDKGNGQYGIFLDLDNGLLKIIRQASDIDAPVDLVSQVVAGGLLNDQWYTLEFERKDALNELTAVVCLGRVDPSISPPLATASVTDASYSIFNRIGLLNLGGGVIYSDDLSVSVVDPFVLTSGQWYTMLLSRTGASVFGRLYAGKIEPSIGQPIASVWAEDNNHSIFDQMNINGGDNFYIDNVGLTAKSSSSVQIPILIGSSSVTGIDGQQSRIVDEQLFLPVSIQAWEYFLGVSVDSIDQVIERNDSNNQLVSSNIVKINN